jgi:formate-dependent nitrite reductase cytochrome c552 subunit
MVVRFDDRVFFLTGVGANQTFSILSAHEPPAKRKGKKDKKGTHLTSPFGRLKSTQKSCHYREAVPDFGFV